jgi:cardiolipin synthase
MISWYWPLLIVEWLIRLVMMPILVRRRGSMVAITWLLVIFFEPFVGLFLYLLIGENRLPRRRIRKHARATGYVDLINKLGRAQPHITRPHLPPEQASLVTLAERLGDLPIVGGNHVEMIPDTAVYIDRLIADIDKAEHHVHVLMYIYEADETGHRVAEALIRAQRRGVTCRVLADAVGSRPLFKGLYKQLLEAGVEVYAALPVNVFRRGLARLDLRNHRKLVVIDGSIAFTGSQNIVDPTYGRKNLVWHDMMLRLTGPVVLHLQGVFVEDWYFETGQMLESPDILPEPRVAGEAIVQVLPSGPTYPTENYQRLVVAALHAAEREVIITSPYLVPDEPLLQAMQTAVLRGVRVDMIVPRRSDQPLASAAGRAYYSQLLEINVNLYLHHEGLLHAKTVTIDDSVALVGSSNFDIRSFKLNFELNLLLYGPQPVAELRHHQKQYMQQSDLLTLQQWRSRPAARRLIEDTARLLSPLL